jgi:two-component system, cell cycle sensor histidine kinase and response regulator CckA
VLVVEDAHEVRALTCAILETDGHHVLSAEDGPEALEKAAAFAGSIDVLVTDVVMPGLDGRQLALELLDRRPALRVVYVSGHTQHEAELRARSGPRSVFLAKPCRPAVLSAHVRALMDEAGEGSRPQV